MGALQIYTDDDDDDGSRVRERLAHQSPIASPMPQPLCHRVTLETVESNVFFP